jgi:hypothetical protein
MIRHRFYLETSVFNHYFSNDRFGYIATKKLFQNIGCRLNYGYISDIVQLELNNAPEPKRSDIFDLIKKYNIIALDTSKEIEDLTDLYLKAGIIPKRIRYDAYRIASATVHDLDCLLTFNLRYINRTKTKILVIGINKSKGYKPIKILSPAEVFNDEA